MRFRIYLASLICLSIMLLMGCSAKNIKTEDKISINSTNTTSQSKDNELLYGKYPEPIIIAIGENNQVNKNYKELTRADLKKIKHLFFNKEYGFNYVAKNYGFEENEEYDFSIILEMPNLEDLSIEFGTSNIRLKDYSILKELDNLKRLNISNIHDSDIDNISSIESLEWLSISYSDITNINFLEKISGLSGLFNLGYCYNIRNFDALKYLKNINQINLCYLNMTEKELSTIPEMSELKYLSLVGNNLTNISNFPVLKNLESLSLDDNPLKSIRIPIGNLSKLKYLNINKTLVSDVNKINGVDTIEEIYIYDSMITKVAPFKKYKNLKSINATLADIKDKETLNGTNIYIIDDYPSK